MELLPALDLRSGRVVRLVQGDDRRRTEYAEEPLAVLRRYRQAGVERAHVVDLDAALGEAPQRRLLERLLASEDVPGIQLGGGLRDRERVRWALDLGCSRVVITSLMVRDFDLFAELAEAHPGRIVAALDVRDGRLQLHGWRDAADRSLESFCAALRPLPLGAVLVTDVERDGMLSGPNLALARELAVAANAPGLLSGGIRSLEHLRAAAATAEIQGAVVGKALYEGALGLDEALRACSGAAA